MKDKKNLENELISDDELENISGGYDYEVFGDVQEFNSLGIKIGTFDHVSNEVMAISGIDMKKMENTFKEYGVTSIQHLGHYSRNHFNKNQYFINGREVSREEAWTHVKSQIK